METKNDSLAEISYQKTTLAQVIKSTKNVLSRSNLHVFCSHFSETNRRAIDEVWYKRAVDHHEVEHESFVYSVPFNAGRCFSVADLTVNKMAAHLPTRRFSEKISKKRKRMKNTFLTTAALDKSLT